jgi:hypothetical protein
MEHMKKAGNFYFIGLMLMLNSCFGDVDLTGLVYSPDPVNERVKQSLVWNKANPSRDMVISGKDYAFLVAGDSQVGGLVNMDTMIARANKPGMSGLVIVGDITTGHDEDFLDLDKELAEKSNVPAFLMIGNHDLFFKGWDTYQSLFKTSTYDFTVKTDNASDLFICLDSGNGTIGSKQLDWLKDRLEKKRSSHRYCIVFTHVNFFREHHTFSACPLVDELHELVALFYEYSVDLVIMGHDHRRSEEFLGRTHYITLDACYDGFEYASYLDLEIKNGKLISNFVEL